MALGAEAQCPVGEYIVRDQTNLNQFQVQWPQCESLDALNVREATAHDLGPLSKIKTIKGNAVFDH
jgi:hypothetical protein